MKCLVYQVSVGKPSSFYKYCNDTVRFYCKRYGIDYIIQERPILKVASKKSDVGLKKFKLNYIPYYEKLNAFSYIHHYDKVCIIDSDIAIKYNSPNIFDEIDNRHDIAGVLERDLPASSQYINLIKKYGHGQYIKIKDEMGIDFNDRGPAYYNSGVLLFNKNILKYLNDDTPKQLIERDEFKRFVDEEGEWVHAGDQTPLNYWFYTERMKIKSLDWKWNALYMALNDNQLKQGNFIHFLLSNGLERKDEEIKRVMTLANNHSPFPGKRKFEAIMDSIKER